MAKMTRTALNRKRQRSEPNESSAAYFSIFGSSNCFRILCLLTFSQVVWSAYHYQNVVHKKSTTTTTTGGSSSRTTSLQFSASGAVVVHPPLVSSGGGSSRSNSALHVASQPGSSTTPEAETESIITSAESSSADDYILPEWELLSEPVQQELKELLSYQKVSTFDHTGLFRLDELTQGHPLLFMSWAILASPYSQPLLNSEEGGSNEEETTRLPSSPSSSSSYLNLLTELNLSPTKLCNFVRAIEAGYPKMNLYHNRVHATDVFQTLHSIFEAEDSVKSQLTSIQQFSLLLAAIMHDVGHDGTNNLLHVQKQSPLAVQFQNVSVLENYHVQLGLQELTASGLLQDLPTDQQLEIHKRITEAILHTDMAKHHAQVDAYKSGKLDIWEKGMYLMHLCDISNPIKSSQSVWGELVMEEFFRIGDEQKLLGVEPTFDRMDTDRVALQQGFLKFMVQPAFEAVTFSDPKIMEGLYATLELVMNQETASSGEANESS